MPPRLTPQILLRAYRLGTFPMAQSRHGRALYWFDPAQRGVLPLERFHMARSLARRMRRAGWQATLDTDFAGVLAACADRPSTWINAEIAALFTALHAQGHAHSLELREDGALIGGVYGLAIGGAFCGESMFSRRTDASKAALAWLVAHLRRCGFVLFDTQYLTDHLASLGAVEIPRPAYHARLAQALAADADIQRHPLPALHDVMQLRTQRS